MFYHVIVIRRMVTQGQSYTVIYLPPDVEQVIPTTDQEHADILRIYKQDGFYPEIQNDFSSLGFGQKKAAR